MNRYKPEILAELQMLVEQKYGRSLCSPTDFVEFSTQISNEGGGRLSSSTLKRLWGYVNDTHTPRAYTLDVLSRYAGFQSYDVFYSHLMERASQHSAFFSGEQLYSSQLKAGQTVEIGWSPNRYVRLFYEGDNRFKVVEVRESQLQVGDRFEVACFYKGKPLYLPCVVRLGERMGAFMAGRDGGLTLLNVVDPECRCL